MVSRLSNAPLAEVVFEMRWSLASLERSPFSNDPNFGAIFDGFTAFAKKSGYKRHVDIAPPYSGMGGSIARRFYSGESGFPLYQIGPGIFAANNSAEYEWKAFRKMAIDGATAVIRSVPTLNEFETRVTNFELRYIDVFDGKLVSPKFQEFLSGGTKIKLAMPALGAATDKIVPSGNGRVQLEYTVSAMPGTTFTLDVASGVRDSDRVARMESRVAWIGSDAIPKKSADFSEGLRDWLEGAHEVTSPTFKSLIADSLYKKLQG